MNNFMKAIGVVILTIGVLVLAIPALMNSANNFTLFTGLILVILGFVAHIVLNKRFADK